MAPTTAYYDKKLSKAEALQQLKKLGAVPNAARSKSGVAKVFTINGGGEAMVTVDAAGLYRLQLYAGACPC